MTTTVETGVPFTLKEFKTGYLPDRYMFCSSNKQSIWSGNNIIIFPSYGCMNIQVLQFFYPSDFITARKRKL